MSGGPRRRDFILIPLISIATIVAMLGFAEMASRVVFVETGKESCGAPDGNLATHFQPNCVSHRKSAEGPMVENAYNDCGYRTPTPCGRHDPGIVRVALMGTSTAQGFKVPYEETFAAQLTRELSRSCGRPVEFQNMGVAGASFVDVWRRLDEALAMRPDLIMLVLSALEVRGGFDVAAVHRLAENAAAPAKPAEALPAAPLVARVSDFLSQSRALVVAQHFLFQDSATYARLYLLHGEEADYLRQPLSASWHAHMDDFARLLGEMAGKARERGIPLLLVWAPTRVQASLVASTARQPGTDPFAIGVEAAAVASRMDAAFVDTFPAMAEKRAPDRFFYAVDGHMNGEGNAVFAASVEQRLRQGDLAPFAACGTAGRDVAISRPSPG